MEKVPNWEWLMVLYFLIVTVPVMLVHGWLKKRVLLNKSVANLFLYFAAVVGTAFLMHFVTMWLYFKFLFNH